MLLNTKHMQVLKDIHQFSRLSRYHGMLPQKHAYLYDDDVLTHLKHENLVERGTVIAPCGNHFKGFKLTENAKRDLKANGLDLDSEVQQKIDAMPEPSEHGLTAELLEILTDVYHLSKVKRFCSIAPKHELVEYDKKDLKFLYEAGYLFYIKLKGSSVKYRKGYVLSEQGRRVLKTLGIVK